MRKQIIIILITFFMVACANCKKVNNDIKIMALLKTSTNPYFVLMWEGLKSEAMKYNVKMDIYWPEKESDFEYQYHILSTKAFEYDVLILSPSDMKNTFKYLKPLKRKGKSIILLDIGVNLPEGENEEDYFDVFAGTDNELGGRLAAEYARKYLKGISNVIVLGGFKYHMETPGRITSFIEYIKKYYPNVNLKKFTADYDREKARTVVRDNLNTFINSDLIYCANDHMALGILDIVNEMDIKRIPHIIGYDSILEAQQAILRGDMDASIAQFPAQMGGEAVKIAMALKRRENVPKRLLIPPKISTKKQFIDTQSLEDVEIK